MKRLWPWAFLMIACCLSCGRESSSVEDKAVQQAALVYYNYLIEGQYEQYVGAIAYSDSMPSSYKSQMVDLTAQYVERERQLKGGLASVRALNDTIMGETACVFLELTYGDSTREEISLPMVRCGDKWKMQ